MVYLLSAREIMEELVRAQERGVVVRVLLEQKPVGGESSNRAAREQLERAGILVRWTNPVYRFTHAKVIVVDSSRAAIMTLNLTASSFSRNREFAVILSDPAIVSSLSELFAAEWDYRQPPKPLPPLVTSPETSRKVLLDLINGARKSLDIYAASFEDDAITAACAAATKRGVRVRLIVTPPTSAGDPNRTERQQLLRSGGQVGLLSTPYVHAKVVIADGMQAFIGSQNFTATSLDQNREIGIIIAHRDVLPRLQRIFQADWDKAKLERREKAA